MQIPTVGIGENLKIQLRVAKKGEMLMSVITAKGSQAKDNAQKTAVDLKDIYLRLKEGESHKVRLLSVEDYVEYQAVGDYNLGIFNQAVSGEDSPLVIANKKGGEKFSSLYIKPRYVFVFGSLETGKLVAWDASKNQAKALISTIEEYAEVAGELAFNFKRTGNKTETVYSLNPIIKMKAEDKEKFESFNGQTVEMDFFESIIQPKDETFLVKLLAEIDSSVLELFPDVDISDQSDKVEPITSEPVEDDLLDSI